MSPYIGLESLLGVSRDNLGPVLTFTFGKESKSPFEDPNIVLPSTIDNFYERLGLENFVDIEKVKTAYRRQALIWHPDRNPGYKEKSEIEFKSITIAYNTLTDPNAKARYDGQLRIKTRTTQKREEGQPPPHAEWRETSRAAQATSRYTRDFRNLEDIDSLLNPEQIVKINYLDFLVDAGELYILRFGEVYISGPPNDCEYCQDSIPNRVAVIGYKTNETTIGDMDVHGLLAHGARAMIVHASSHTLGDVKRAFAIVDYIYSSLKIQLPPKGMADQVQMPIPHR